VFHPVKGRFACGSMVLLFSFSQKNSLSEFFCEKDLASSALSEAIPRQTRDCRIYVSIGRFVLFAHVVVFVVQTPPA
jgi:hypothetical protein